MAEVIRLKLPFQRQFRPISFRSENGDIRFLRNVCNILQYYVLLKPTRLQLEMSSFLFFTEECSGKKLRKLRQCSRKFDAAYESSRNDPKILLSNYEFDVSVTMYR